MHVAPRHHAHRFSVEQRNVDISQRLSSWKGGIQAKQKHNRTDGGQTTIVVAIRRKGAHGGVMFDYAATAELYSRRSGRKARSNIGYQRFSRASDAILYIIERLPSGDLVGVSLEVNDERFGPAGIRALYDDDAFPLQRNKAR